VPGFEEVLYFKGCPVVSEDLRVPEVANHMSPTLLLLHILCQKARYAEDYVSALPFYLRDPLNVKCLTEIHCLLYFEEFNLMILCSLQIKEIVMILQLVDVSYLIFKDCQVKADLNHLIIHCVFANKALDLKEKLLE